MRTLRPASATRTDPPFPSATLLRSRQGIPVLPVDRSGLTADLQTLFGELFGRPADDQRGSGVPAASPDDLIDVLVAEDNPVNQIVFSQIIEGFGYRYAIAPTGPEAVRLWREK